MTSLTLDWALKIKAFHDEYHIPEMSDCVEECVDALSIIDEEEKNEHGLGSGP